MADELVLYTNPMSRGRAVRWMLEETGQPYRVEPVALGAAPRSAAFLAINPMGKVPALTHRGVVVTEAAAICAFLADAFPEAGLAPAPTSPERGAYLRWLFFAAGPVEQAVIDRALGVTVPAERRGMSGYGGSLDAALDVLEGAVEKADRAGGHLAGERFTAADLFVAAQVGFGIMFKIIADRPVLADYARRMGERPAARRAAAADDALLALPAAPAPAAGG